MNAEDKRSVQAFRDKLNIVRAKGGKINPFETEDDKQTRIRRAKEDVSYFIKTYLPHYATHESADFQINLCNTVRYNPLFFGYAEWGRGLAKSVYIDVIIPLWLWINKETRFFCLISDTFDRARDLLDDIQIEFEGNELLINDFGSQKNPGNWESGNFITANGFICKAFGAKQKVRGLRVGPIRPDMWGVDDLETPITIKNGRIQDDLADWIESDVIPTMVSDNRRLIGANNRFAERMVQTILKERHPEWTWDLVPAYDPVTYEPTWKRYTPEFYRQQEKDMTVIKAHSEYNHVPYVKGRIFSPDMIKWAPLPDLHKMNAIVSHWDVAYSGSKDSDYNAVRIWGRYKNFFYLIGCFVMQCKMRTALDWMCMKEREFKKNGVTVFWFFESQFWNDELERNLQEAQRDAGVELILSQSKRRNNAKLLDLLSMHPYYQNGRMIYNEQLKSDSSCLVGQRQLCAVEPGMTEHDDAPDADQQAIKQLEYYTDSKEETEEKKTQDDHYQYKKRKRYTD